MSVAGSAFGGGLALMRARFAVYGTLALALAAVAFLAVPAAAGGAPLSLARALTALGLVALAFGLPAGARRLDRELHAALPRTVLGAAVLLAAGLAADLGPSTLILPVVVVSALLGRAALLRWIDGRTPLHLTLRISDVAFSGIVLAVGGTAAVLVEFAHRGSIAVTAPLLMLVVAYAECVRITMTRPRLRRPRGEAATIG